MIFDCLMYGSLPHFPPLGHGGKLVFLIWAWEFNCARVCYDCALEIFINQVVIISPKFGGIAFVVCVVVSCDDVYVLLWDFQWQVVWHFCRGWSSVGLCSLAAFHTVGTSLHFASAIFVAFSFFLLFLIFRPSTSFFFIQFVRSLLFSSALPFVMLPLFVFVLACVAGQSPVLLICRFVVGICSLVWRAFF